MSFRSQDRYIRQRGYILLVLMLFVALLAIGALAMVEKIDFQIKRDREEEMIHRGVQYSRAVRRYFKKFGRYPTRIEELEDTNHIRFLRQRYKDPITGKDFKPLHITDVQMSFAPQVSGGPTPAQVAAGVTTSQVGASQAGIVARGPSAIGTDAPTGDPGLTVDTGQDDTARGVTGQQPSNSSQPVSPQTAAQQAGAMATSTPGPQVFGGGAIVGVVSTSKLRTIREFNKKDHYNQWQFIYDPSSDRGGLLMTPNQPPLKGATPLNPQQTGQQENQNQGDRGNPVQHPQPPQTPDQQ
jgi:type II secretory pathway pseudopilin PulG